MKVVLLALLLTGIEFSILGVTQSIPVQLFVSGEWASNPNPRSGVIYKVDLEILAMKTKVVSNLEFPLDGVCGPDGYIYFVDYGDNKVIRFRPDGRDRQTVAQIPRPTALTFSPGGDLFVNAAQGVWRIRFKRGEPQQPEQVTPRFSEGVSLINALYSIAVNVGGIAFLPDETMLVVDTPGGLIYKVSPPKFDTPEIFIASYMDERGRIQQLSTPIGIAVNSRGEIFVAEANQRRILKFSPNGEFIAALPGSQYIPIHLEFDSSDNLYVTNWGLYVGEGKVIFIPASMDRIEHIISLTDAWGLAVCSSATR